MSGICRLKNHRCNQHQRRVKFKKDEGLPKRMFTVFEYDFVLTKIRFSYITQYAILYGERPLIR